MLQPDASLRDREEQNAFASCPVELGKPFKCVAFAVVRCTTLYHKSLSNEYRFYQPKNGVNCKHTHPTIFLKLSEYTTVLPFSHSSSFLSCLSQQTCKIPLPGCLSKQTTSCLRKRKGNHKRHSWAVSPPSQCH